MYNSQYYTCEQIDERLLQGYLDDYNSQTGQSLTKAQFLTALFNAISVASEVQTDLENLGKDINLLTNIIATEVSKGSLITPSAYKKGKIYKVDLGDQGPNFSAFVRGYQYYIAKVDGAAGDRLDDTDKFETTYSSIEALNKVIDYIETGNTCPPATQTTPGLVQPRHQDNTNRSGLLITDDEGSMQINTRADLGLYIDGSGQLQANIKRSATDDDIDKIGTPQAPNAAAVTTANAEKVAEKLGLVVNVMPITYSRLVDLRDSGKLVAGQQYRIVDYHTTTSQDYTRSADHQFDVIVRADSVNTLNENAFACLHDGDDYFSRYGAKLEAWKLKYCIDNDSTRFAWADEENGTGVIYEMIDEHNNRCGYDFKNIMFSRTYAEVKDVTGMYSRVKGYLFNINDIGINNSHNNELVNLFVNVDNDNTDYVYTFSRLIDYDESLKTKNNQCDASVVYHHIATGTNLSAKENYSIINYPYNNTILNVYKAFNIDDNVVSISYLPDICFVEIEYSKDNDGYRVFNNTFYDCLHLTMCADEIHDSEFHRVNTSYFLSHINSSTVINSIDIAIFDIYNCNIKQLMHSILKGYYDNTCIRDSTNIYIGYVDEGVTDSIISGCSYLFIYYLDNFIHVNLFKVSNTSFYEVNLDIVTVKDVNNLYMEDSGIEMMDCIIDSVDGAVGRSVNFDDFMDKLGDNGLINKILTIRTINKLTALLFYFDPYDDQEGFVKLKYEL